MLIGELLSKTRAKQGLELEQVALATTIPVKHLVALEEERFDELPGKAYAKSFLREYATFLKLDPRPLLEELDSRLGENEPGPVMLVPGRRSIRPIWALFAVVCALAITLIAWQAGGGHHQHALVKAHSTQPVTTTSPAAVPAKPSTTWVRLALIASRGPCWLSVHAGSRTGPLLYENTLQRAGILRFARKQFWIRLGAPWNLDLLLDGQAVSLPPSTRPINVVVAKGGVKQA